MHKIIILLLMFVVMVIGSDYLTCPRPHQKNNHFRSPKYLKLQEKVLRNIPCDLTTNNYCNIPGDHYPWPSVRRFVYENQGLIRRMYGEVRQLSVLRMEMDFIENNSIDDVNDMRSNQDDNKLQTINTEIVEENNNNTDEQTMTTIVPDISSSELNSDVTVSNNEEVEMTTIKSDLIDLTTIVYFKDALENNNNNTNEVIIPKNNIIEQSPQQQEPPQQPQQQSKPQLKAVNACPVKEEVVAPYWANNTRGEILALLNLYPFEQYIHWEKCHQENQQMFCRNGCRCEQQYRLHRLLAFDPTNECRGIFSDWFRFPSCCICKCYLTTEEIKLYRNIDDELLLPSNSRSPRTINNNNYDDDDDDISDILFDDEMMLINENFEFSNQPDVDGVAINNHFFYNKHRDDQLVPRK